VNTRHGRAQVNLHFTVQTGEANWTNAVVPAQNRYARRVVDAGLRGTKVNLPLAVAAREALKARARVTTHILRGHAYAAVGALDRRGLTRIGLHLTQHARVPRAAYTLKSVPAREALRAVATRRRGTIVYVELTARSGVSRWTAALTLPTASTVCTRRAATTRAGD
jgi:hypothetical protein